LTLFPIDDDNDTQLTSPVDGDVEHATTTKKTGTKRSFRKSQEDGDDVTAEQVEKGFCCFSLCELSIMHT